jgi:hypothetical protein
MKIRTVGAELLHADRRTQRQADKQKNTHTHRYMTKLEDDFRNFVNAPKNTTDSFHHKSDRANFDFIQIKPNRILFTLRTLIALFHLWNPTKLSR